MRTDAEIVERVREVEKHDWLGTERSDLVAVLPFEQAREFLKDSIEESGWKQLARDEGAVKDRMHDYMPFAWKKANGRRGISAGRSLDHMSAWLWLLGREAAAEQVPRVRPVREAAAARHLRSLRVGLETVGRRPVDERRNRGRTTAAHRGRSATVTRDAQRRQGHTTRAPRHEQDIDEERRTAGTSTRRRRPEWLREEANAAEGKKTERKKRHAAQGPRSDSASGPIKPKPRTGSTRAKGPRTSSRKSNRGKQRGSASHRNRPGAEATGKPSTAEDREHDQSTPESRRREKRGEAVGRRGPKSENGGDAVQPCERTARRAGDATGHVTLTRPRGEYGHRAEYAPPSRTERLSSSGNQREDAAQTREAYSGDGVSNDGTNRAVERQARPERVKQKSCHPTCRAQRPPTRGPESGTAQPDGRGSRRESEDKAQRSNSGTENLESRATAESLHRQRMTAAGVPAGTRAGDDAGEAESRGTGTRTRRDNDQIQELEDDANTTAPTEQRTVGQDGTGPERRRRSTRSRVENATAKRPPAGGDATERSGHDKGAKDPRETARAAGKATRMRQRRAAGRRRNRTSGKHAAPTGPRDTGVPGIQTDEPGFTNTRARATA